jgi:acyl-coenzyme A synthetase/AMP-(fatty) acid ligase
MAKRDSDGFYYIAGRKKRFLKIFGSRVNMDEAERMVKDSFPGLDAACGGEDDNMAVYVTDGSKAGEVAKFLAAKTGLNRSAFSVTAVGAIPRSDSGKILYGELGKS